MVTRMKACLNGGRGRADHPAVPVTPAELAADAVAAVSEGAQALHIHPRGKDGQESLRAADVAAAVSGIRTACPGVPVGVSTGLWITGGDHLARRELVAGWAGLPSRDRPDFASVNVSERGFADLTALPGAAGIDVEAGVWSVADAEALAVGGPPVVAGRTGWWRILVEVLDATAETAVSVAGSILRRLDELAVVGPRLLHGEDAACWPLVAHAGRLGLPTRIGLEDTVAGPAGEPVAGNADLVRLGIALWTTGSHDVDSGPRNRY